jgi:lipopolysaccharide export system protein LptC
MPRPLLQILLALSLVLAANYYWDPSPAPTSDPSTSARQQDLPRTYIDSARTWSFDAQGDLNDIVEAERVEQFPQRNQSTMAKPRFYSHSKNDKTWSATADRGRFFHRTERLMLRFDVVLTHDQTGTRMNSDALDIYLKKRTAESDRQVTITSGQNRTVADGLLANLDLETLELKPNVESVYVVQSEPATP